MRVRTLHWTPCCAEAWFACISRWVSWLAFASWLTLLIPLCAQQHACHFPLGSSLTTSLLLSRHAPSSNAQRACMRDLAVQIDLAAQTRTVLNGWFALLAVCLGPRCKCLLLQAAGETLQHFPSTNLRIVCCSGTLV